MTNRKRALARMKTEHKAIFMANLSRAIKAQIKAGTIRIEQDADTGLCLLVPVLFDAEIGRSK